MKPHDGISVLISKGRDIKTSSLCYVKAQPEGSCLQVRKDSPRTESATTLIFPNLQNSGNKCHLFKPPSVIFCYRVQTDKDTYLENNNLAKFNYLSQCILISGKGIGNQHVLTKGWIFSFCWLQLPFPGSPIRK